MADSQPCGALMIWMRSALLTENLLKEKICTIQTTNIDGIRKNGINLTPVSRIVLCQSRKPVFITELVYPASRCDHIRLGWIGATTRFSCIFESFEYTSYILYAVNLEWSYKSQYTPG